MAGGCTIVCIAVQLTLVCMMACVQGNESKPVLGLVSVTRLVSLFKLTAGKCFLPLGLWIVLLLSRASDQMHHCDNTACLQWNHTISNSTGHQTVS